MPTYEYRCPKGHTFDVFQRMSDEPGAECPECGEPSERLLSAGAGLLFKGEGFYITDYRSESYKKAAAKETGGDAGKSGKSSGDGGTASSSSSSSKD
jgi:putative FmdB family regulatory protein